MFCPKCGCPDVNGDECPKCGISVIAYLKDGVKTIDANQVSPTPPPSPQSGRCSTEEKIQIFSHRVNKETVNASQNSTKQYIFGIRTDAKNMTRNERLSSAASFLKITLVLLALIIPMFWIGFNNENPWLFVVGIVGIMLTLALLFPLTLGAVYLLAKGLLRGK